MRLYKIFAVIAESADIINLTLEKREAARFSVETLDAASSILEDTSRTRISTDVRPTRFFCCASRCCVLNSGRHCSHTDLQGAKLAAV